MSTSGRLTQVYQQAEKIYYDRDDRFIIMSDCHRGAGDNGDNFIRNQSIYLAALKHYNCRKYTYLELGDGDELWENKDMEQIKKAHSPVFSLLSEFYNDGRLYMLYGNHDMQKKKDSGVKEALILEEKRSGQRIFLVHGHQGDLMNDKLWKVSRFLVRHIWKRLELLGAENPMSASGNGKKKTKVERRLTEWANTNRQITVAGHTHRAKFPEKDNFYYFNDGSCVRPTSVTGIELEQGWLRLVEWSIMTKADYSMFVGRRVLEERNLDYYREEGFYP